MEDDGEIFKVVTANRLRDGVIVYLQVAGDGTASWVEQIADATAFDEHEIEDALAQANPFVDDCLIIDLYATEVAGRNRPLSAREVVRAKGPSIKYGHAAIEPDFSI